MIRLHSIESKIPDLTAGAVLVIAASSFLLSFFNLRATALESGINPWLSWLWPVCIDALLIAGSLMILRSNLRKEPGYVGWTTLLSFTAVSTLFNVIHSPDGIINQAAHAVPPISLCVSIELLMLCIRSDLQQPTPEPEEVQPVRNEPTEPAPKKSTRDVIVAYFQDNPDASTRQAASDLTLHQTTIQRHLKVLNAAGLLQQQGEL